MSSAPDNDARDIASLLSIMATLRNPDGGCPWDLEQEFATIAPYTIEEAYEVADAIDRGVELAAAYAEADLVILDRVPAHEKQVRRRAL